MKKKHKIRCRPRATKFTRPSLWVGHHLQPLKGLVFGVILALGRIVSEISAGIFLKHGRSHREFSWPSFDLFKVVKVKGHAGFRILGVKFLLMSHNNHMGLSLTVPALWPQNHRLTDNRHRIRARSDSGLKTDSKCLNCYSFIRIIWRYFDL